MGEPEKAVGCTSRFTLCSRLPEWQAGDCFQVVKQFRFQSLQAAMEELEEKKGPPAASACAVPLG